LETPSNESHIIEIETPQYIHDSVCDILMTKK
jgi:hypothetical protein